MANRTLNLLEDIVIGTKNGIKADKPRHNVKKFPFSTIEHQKTIIDGPDINPVYVLTLYFDEKPKDTRNIYTLEYNKKTIYYRRFYLSEYPSD